MTFSVEGIIFSSSPLLNKKKIFQCLTKEKGILSCISSQDIFPFLLVPFSHVEMDIYKKASDLFLVHDAALIYTNNVNTTFDHLACACNMVNALRMFLPLQTPSFSLYALFRSFLYKLPYFSSPFTLYTAFLLKILVHEGFLALQTHCSYCANLANGIEEGFSCCENHGSIHSTFFSPSDWEILFLLAYGKKFSDWEKINVSTEMQEKTKKIFDSLIKDPLQGKSNGSAKTKR